MRSSKNRSRNKNRNRPQGGNVINRVFDSSGPEGKVRGTPQQIIDKYTQLARDAQLAGDRVAVENFQQHAEHYTRMLAEAQKEMDARRDQQDREQQARQDRERAERDARREDRQDRDDDRNSHARADGDDGRRSDERDDRRDDRRDERSDARRSDDDERDGRLDFRDSRGDDDGEERRGRRGGNRRRGQRDDQPSDDPLDLRGGDAGGGPVDVPESQTSDPQPATQPSEDAKPRRRRARKPNNDPRDAEGEGMGQETAAE